MIHKKLCKGLLLIICVPFLLIITCIIGLCQVSLIKCGCIEDPFKKDEKRFKERQEMEQKIISEVPEISFTEVSSLELPIVEMV